MKTVGLFLVVATLGCLGCAALWATEYYRLSGIRRVDQDLYRAGNLYVETQYCYHYTYGEEAVLKWEGRYGQNTVIWDDDSTCQVKTVFSK
jgi:hypothetical protein